MQAETLIETTVNEAPESTAYFVRAFRDMPGCVLVIGPHGKIVFANKAAQEAMEIGDYVGRSFAEYFVVFPNSANDPFYEAILDTIRNKHTPHYGRFLYVSPSGRRYAFFLTSSYLLGEGDEPYLVITCTDVTAEEAMEHHRRESAFLLVSTILYLCMSMFAYAIWEHFGHPLNVAHFTGALEAASLVLGFLALRFTSLTTEDLGLGTRRLGRNLAVGAGASVAVVAVLAAIKLLLAHMAPDLVAHPEALLVSGHFSPSLIFTGVLAAFIQEFLTRGIMQQSALRILGGRHKHALAVVVSSIMSACLLIAYGPVYMLGAVMLLSMLGVVYDRQKSIWGVVLIHALCLVGASAFGLI